MTKFVHTDVLNNGPSYIKTNCNKMVLISSYVFLVTYAAVNATILAEVGMISSDFTLATNVNDRTLTTAAGKFDASANATGGSASNHIAFLDNVNSKVLWVTEKTSEQVISAGNQVNFPSLVYTSKHPT